ncbi:hypothetical protein ACIG5E_10030 [Kitasatospora sp. NPDC053057]|uniref:hypothetical protein n=1 Tax=Kitasatospora sp. NPDC053057 TaxID=3364062 RepID=UPI0037C58547
MIRKTGKPGAIRSSSPHTLARAVSALVQLIGLIGFELHGHLVGSLDPATDFFAWTSEETADAIGL